MSGNTRRVQTRETVSSGLRLGWRAGLFIALVMLTVVMTGIGLYQVNESYRITRLGHELEQSRLAQRDLLEEEKRLRIRIDAHKHPNQVKQKAQNLHMRRARPTDEFYVPSRAEQGWPQVAEETPGAEEASP
ncbi:MAG: hypothetical protein VYE15_04670 [Myxococcota bacterium]|nr:hypothetical protein [Myxococcota bacterium]